MLDIKAIREQPDFYKQALARKGVSSSTIDEVIDYDRRRCEAQQKLDDLKAEQNTASKQIPNLKEAEKKELLARMSTLSKEKKTLEDEHKILEATLQQRLEALPNPPHPDAPDGKSDEENVVIRTVGQKPSFDFEPREHFEIGEMLNLIDTERSAKVSGSRFYYLRNELAILQQALMFWAFQEVTQKGFSPTIPPFLTRKEAIYGTGYLDKDENYIINPGEDDLYLIGTSEVPMTSFFAGETLTSDQLPAKFVSYSPCFRREAGSYGKDTKGIFRVHQFEKIEMVVFCKPEESTAIHEEIREIEESLLQKLGIHYQVVNVCCGDLGNSAAKKYDLEAWLPGQGKYREMTSTSICTDFQTRRLGTRFKDTDGKLQYVHTLNGTAVSSRPLVAILENFQHADGSVDIPEVLQPYCGFKRIEKA